jgi:hypothetical protein
MIVLLSLYHILTEVVYMPRKKNQVPGQIDLPLTAPEPTTVKNKMDRKKTETTTKPKTKELEKKAKSPVKDSEPGQLPTA